MVNKLLTDPMKNILAAASNKANADSSFAPKTGSTGPPMLPAEQQQQQHPPSSVTSGSVVDNKNNDSNNKNNFSSSCRTPSPTARPNSNGSKDPASSPIPCIGNSTTNSDALSYADNSCSTAKQSSSKVKGKGPCGYIPPPPPPKVEPGSYSCQEPGDSDVLCGRGSRVNNHTGNVEFRQLVGQFKDMYLDSSRRKIEKAHICAYVVSLVRELRHGHFLTYCPSTQTWEEVGDIKARKKAGQALREDATELRAAEAEQQQVMKHQNKQEEVNSNDSETKKSSAPIRPLSAMNGDEHAAVVASLKKNKKKTSAAAIVKGGFGIGDGGPQPIMTPSSPPEVDNDLLMEDMLMRASVDSFRISLEEGNVCGEIDFAQFMNESDRKDMAAQQEQKQALKAAASRKRRSGGPLDGDDVVNEDSAAFSSLNSSNKTIQASNLHDSLMEIGPNTVPTGIGADSSRNIHNVSLMSNSSSTTTRSGIGEALAAAAEQDENLRQQMQHQQQQQQQHLFSQQPAQGHPARVSLQGNGLDDTHQNLQQQLQQQQERLNALCAAANSSQVGSTNASSAATSSAGKLQSKNTGNLRQNFSLNLGAGAGRNDPYEPSPLPEPFSPALLQAFAVQQQQQQHQRLERGISDATGMSVGDSFTMMMLRDSMGSFNPSSFGNNNNHNFLLASNNSTNTFMTNNNSTALGSMNRDADVGGSISSIDFARFLSDKDKAEMLMHYGASARGGSIGAAAAGHASSIPGANQEQRGGSTATLNSHNNMVAIRSPSPIKNETTSSIRHGHLSEQEAAAASEAFQAARLRLRLGTHQFDNQTETIDEIMSSQMSVVSLNENNDNTNKSNENEHLGGGGLGGGSNSLRESLGMATMMADSVRSTAEYSAGTTTTDLNRFSFSRFAE